MTKAARNIEQPVVTEDTIIIPKRRGVKSIEVDDELMQDIREIVKERASAILLNILIDLHAADIAHIINRLETEDQLYVFNLLPLDVASAVLLELELEVRKSIVESLPSEQITNYVSQLASDDVADLLTELSPPLAENILRAMPVEKSADVKELMRYPEDTAGGIMGTEFVAVNMKDTVKQAIRKVRQMAKEEIQIYTVYVTDEQGVLVGSVPLQSLVLHSPNKRIFKIMNTDTKSIGTHVDQEEVAAMFRKYDLVSLPVVDRMGRLVGRITIDDIVDVIEEEHSEDVARMIGSDADELAHRTPVQIAMLRLPWVLMTLGIQFLAGYVVHIFDKTLSAVILLASFMPIISAISGNTGLQSAAIIVRGIATGHISLQRWWQPILRQLQTTLIIGIVCGLVVGTIGGLWHGKWEFGFVVGFSMLLAINTSGFIGTCAPMISKKLGFDPALTAGPFETAFQDVIGITIFLSLATLLLHSIM